MSIVCVGPFTPQAKGFTKNSPGALHALLFELELRRPFMESRPSDITRLKKMLAESLLKNRVLEAVCEKKL
jgi:hypothetical protein